MKKEIEKIKSDLEDALWVNQRELYSLRQKGVSMDSLLLLEQQQKLMLEHYAKCTLLEPMKPFVIEKNKSNQKYINALREDRNYLFGGDKEDDL